MPATMREAVETYLGWWDEAGVSDFTGEAPCDWFALEARPKAAAPVATTARVNLQRAPPPVQSQTVASPRAPLRPPTPVDAAARQLVAGARTLDELFALLQGFDGCNLRVTAKNLCFYRGAARSRVMLIGEAPGRDEDLAGKPFVGRAGQLLDKMLASIGLDESKVHIANTVYWRPPGNRNPTPEETLACAPFLARQMELVDPELIVLLGGVAAKTMLGVEEGITRLRGKWRSLPIGGREVKTLATWHPAYLLRTPAAKRQAWQDLLMLEAALQI